MRFVRIAFVLLVSLIAIAPIVAQRNLKVMVLYDMEGISGATEFKHTTVSYPAEYAVGRQSLTDDVNAAIAGLKAAGATEIVVVDGHGSGNSNGPDVFEDKLLAPAKMMYRDRSFDIYMDSYDHSFDAIIAVGMHAAAGHPIGFLAHTYTFEDTEYKVNGVPFSESMILAAGAGRFKIPLIMVSGDDQLEREVRRNMPWVRYATVKRAVDRSKATAFAKDEVLRNIQAAARDALTRLSEAKLPEWPGPYRFALSFQDEAQARNAALVPGAEYISGSLSVQIRANDFEEGYRTSLRLIGLASLIGRNTARISVINSRPDATQVNRDTTDRIYDRFFERTSPAAPATAAAPSRFWGAR